VDRDKPLVYIISATPSTTTATTTIQRYTWTQEFKMRAETGGGWAPFVLEKELVVSLRPYFEDNTVSIEKAVLSFTLKEAGLLTPERRRVKIFCNGIKVYDKSVLAAPEAVAPVAVAGTIEIPTGYLAPQTQFRVEI